MAWWEKPVKNYMVVTFTRKRGLLDVLALHFSTKKCVTIVDLFGMGESLANKFIDNFSIDIALIEDEFVEMDQDSPVYKIIEESLCGSRGANIHFVLGYDCPTAEKVSALSESLLAKKLPVTLFRLDDEDTDTYIILAQTIESVLMGREQMAKISQI